MWKVDPNRPAHGADTDGARLHGRFGPALLNDHGCAEDVPHGNHRTSQDDGVSGIAKASPIHPIPGANSNMIRQRRSRWGDPTPESPALHTAIFVTENFGAQCDDKLTHSRSEEFSDRLNDRAPFQLERFSTSPPTYDSQGRRTGTRELRYRKRSEAERMNIFDQISKIDANPRSPTEYYQQKRSSRASNKVYIPVKEFPQINFFGLLVGPRGNSLKKMERESGAKISIRGKGSVKEGKARPDHLADDAEEDLHCLITADNEEKIGACVKMINNVIETAASTPEGQNDHKRHQLRELAALNGTLRDDENRLCQNCGGLGHRKHECTERRNVTANIICHTCGSAGHMARDCIANKSYSTMTSLDRIALTGMGFGPDYVNSEFGATTDKRSTNSPSTPAWFRDQDNGVAVVGTTPWSASRPWETNATNITQPSAGSCSPRTGQAHVFPCQPCTSRPSQVGNGYDPRQYHNFSADHARNQGRLYNEHIGV